MIDWNKGKAVEFLLESLGTKFSLCGTHARAHFDIQDLNNLFKHDIM